MSIRISASLSCCSNVHRTSAEMITGYGEVTNAYLAIALKMSRTATFVVKDLL